MNEKNLDKISLKKEKKALLAHVTETCSFRHGWVKPQMRPPRLPSPYNSACTPALGEVTSNSSCNPILTTVHSFIPTKCDLIFSPVSTKSYKPASLLLEWDVVPIHDQ